MKFQKIFIENNIKDSLVVERVICKYPNISVCYLDTIDDIFSIVKKPYLHKRTNLYLFIAEKKGTIVKLAPDTYGIGAEDPHYFFIHALNCIYECEYCYLQGYFHSPDIVLYINYTDIAKAIENIMLQYNEEQKVWFHAGEYSDSLALADLTQEWDYYLPILHKHPNAFLELRTKSTHISSLLSISPSPNFIISYSLTTQELAQKFEHKVPTINSRLRAIKKLVDHGYRIGIHFDPVIYVDDYLNQYKTLFNQLVEVLPNEQLLYISLGVVRFPKSIFHELQKNYPSSELNMPVYSISFDQKVRYNRPQRLSMLNSLKEELLVLGFDAYKIYFCMEEWD